MTEGSTFALRTVETMRWARGSPSEVCIQVSDKAQSIRLSEECIHTSDRPTSPQAASIEPTQGLGAASWPLPSTRNAPKPLPCAECAQWDSAHRVGAPY